MSTQRLPNLPICVPTSHLPHVALLTSQKGGPAGPSDCPGVALSGPAVVSAGPAVALEVREKRRAMVIYLLLPPSSPSSTDFRRTHLTAVIPSCLPPLGEQQPYLPPAVEEGKSHTAATRFPITSVSKPVRGEG